LAAQSIGTMVAVGAVLLIGIEGLLTYLELTYPSMY
jgi:hypothetical protein